MLVHLHLKKALAWNNVAPSVVTFLNIKTEGRKEAELNDRGFNRRKNTTSSLTQEKSNHVEHT
jgi:uncharacterized protein (DUF2384 family)